MKKSVLALLLVGALLLSGCSGVSQESGISTPAESTKSGSTSSTSSVVSSVPTGGDKDQEKFDHKCKTIIEQMIGSMNEYSYSVQTDESSLQYDDNEISLSKILVEKVSGVGEEGRALFAFIDIYSEDEYQYFQTIKNFINFIDENAVEISGSSLYFIAINATENAEIDISITRDEYGTDITYGDRRIQAAYSERLKSMDLLKDSDEQITLPGLIKYDDLPSNVNSYDITVKYQDKELTHRWYKLENGKDDIVFVTYIDDGTYDNISDEDLIYYAYNSILDPKNELNQHSSYDFYIAFKSVKEVACSAYYSYSSLFAEYNSLHWIGQYEHLNSNPLNQELLGILKGESE